MLPIKLQGKMLFSLQLQLEIFDRHVANWFFAFGHSNGYLTVIICDRLFRVEL